MKDIFCRSLLLLTRRHCLVRQEEGDVMSATVAAALKKAAVYILGDEKSEASL